MLTLTIHGLPTAQGSKRAFINQRTGRAQMTEQTGDKLRTWRQDVKAAALNTIANQPPSWHTIDYPVAVHVQFRFLRPKSHYRTGRNAHLLKDDAPAFPTSRNVGDLEKIVRSGHDALTAAGLWTDDSLVVELHASKVYVADPGQVGATMTIAPPPVLAHVVPSCVGDRLEEAMF